MLTRGFFSLKAVDKSVTKEVMDMEPAPWR
jgi:hypothetical protein